MISNVLKLICFNARQVTTVIVAKVLIFAGFVVFSQPTFSQITVNRCNFSHCIVNGCQNSEGAYYSVIGMATFEYNFCFESFAETRQGVCEGLLAKIQSQPLVSPSIGLYTFTSATLTTACQLSYFDGRNTGTTMVGIYKLREPRIDIYTIQITGDSSTTEPWHKKHDKEHLKGNLHFKAIVKDQSGQPKTDFAVTITTDVTTGDPLKDGGHVHINGRPKGKLVEQVGTAVKTKDWKVEIKGKTNGSGIFEFTFGAEEASGTHTLTAKCDSGCQAPATATVNVKVDGLEQIPDGASFYTFIGDTAEHDMNHYLTPDAATNILYIAASYRAEVKFWKRLKGKKPIPRLPMRLNDASLIWGGLFDIKGKWKPAHEGHRKGIEIDVKANDDTGATGAIPLSSFDDFKKMALRYYGADAQVHCTSNRTDGQNRKPPACIGKDGSQDSNRHFHILLLGDDQ